MVSVFIKSSPEAISQGYLTNRLTFIFVFSPDTGKNGPEKNPYLDTFHTVCDF